MNDPKSRITSLDEIASFDDIIDVRTPLEFAQDRIPGAINAPVLSNVQRAEIGTLYKASPFDATRKGAAMVAQNIAVHLDTLFADRPQQWRPLIYCWRGGKRSGAMTTWFNLIGWRAKQLGGGYKAYRRDVLQKLETLPGQFRYVVLAGHTGTGKTRLLQALSRAGAQTLDLEQLARHRGSLLGAWPGCPQPAQTGFESALLAQISSFDYSRPVFIEAESKRSGRVSVPTALLDAFHQGLYIQVEAGMEERVNFLMADYAHLFSEPDTFKQLLSHLVGLHSKDTVARWHTLIDSDARFTLFHELITQHYDPAYARSSAKNLAGRTPAMRFAFQPGKSDCLDQAQVLLTHLENHDTPCTSLELNNDVNA